jgi:hypothetical protein
LRLAKGESASYGKGHRIVAPRRFLRTLHSGSSAECISHNAVFPCK